MDLNSESTSWDRKFQNQEYTFKEQLRMAENEKNKHLEANRLDREKFENTMEDIRVK